MWITYHHHKQPIAPPLTDLFQCLRFVNKSNVMTLHVAPVSILSSTRLPLIFHRAENFTLTSRLDNSVNNIQVIFALIIRKLGEDFVDYIRLLRFDHSPRGPRRVLAFLERRANFFEMVWFSAMKKFSTERWAGFQLCWMIFATILEFTDVRLRCFFR